MKMDALMEKQCCCHTSSFWSYNLPARHVKSGSAAQTCRATAVKRDRRLASFRRSAVVEDDTKIAESEDVDIRDLDSKAFKAMFDSLLEKTKIQYDVGDKVKGIVESVDDGGAYIDIGAKAAAFLPTSNISRLKLPRASKAIQAGEEREFLVSEKHLRSRRRRPAVVLSIKEFEHEVIWKRISQLAEEKAYFEETVTGFNNGGLFVTLEGIRAFCPGSHIPQSERRDGMEGLVGRPLMFSVLEADEPRLILSARQQMQGRSAEQKEYKLGDVAMGTVQSVQLYGAFVDLEDGTTGLLHISQISHDRVASVADVLSIGDNIKVMVLSHDAVRNRLSLSTRNLEPTPGDMLRNPAIVSEKADEMAEEFRKRIAEAEAEFNTEGGNGA